MSNSRSQQSAISEAPTPVQTLPLTDQVRQPDVNPRSTPRPAADVYVAPHALDLLQIGDPDHPHTQCIALPGERHDLDQVVHAILVIGLTVSSVLMITGLVLGLVVQRAVPDAMPEIAEIFGRIVSLRPSGYLALGLLVLIATPILRVIGSIAAFVSERDWRYAAITTGVLLVVLFSLLIGKEG